LVAIAEGLRELGVPIFANRDYWSVAGDFLLRRSEIDFRDCDVVVFDSDFYYMSLEHLLPPDLFHPGARYTLVYVDHADGRYTHGLRPEMRQAQVILKSHYNRKFRNPANYVPWQFGLTRRIIDAVSPRPAEERRPAFLHAARVTHSLRHLAARRIAPLFRELLEEDTAVDDFADVSTMSPAERELWAKTGRRHYPAFYRRLSEAVACFAFGGHLLKFFSDRDTVLNDVLYRINWRVPIFSYDRIFQFDSWRFWESMVAGCATVHVDLSHYGAVLPVMPANGLHYLGVDFNDVDGFRRKLRGQGRRWLDDIGAAGREWALAHYAPRPVAERFLDVVAAHQRAPRTFSAAP
jgi:hypothetical protein